MGFVIFKSWLHLRMKFSVLIPALLFVLRVAAQPALYTTANAHAHNDYRNTTPYWNAYQHGFGSIEADVYLRSGELIVAHDTQEIRLHRTLEQLYLLPVQSCLQQNNGSPYPDKTIQLQMLIDIKADSVNALNELIRELEQHPLLTHTPLVKWVISGNRPAPGAFNSYPSYIWFDGELNRSYSPDALKKIVMFSDDFARYSEWKGTGPLPDADRERLQAAIGLARKAGKTVRFWNAPDTAAAWQEFMKLKVDFINTDHLAGLDDYLKTFLKNK